MSMLTEALNLAASGMPVFPAATRMIARGRAGFEAFGADQRGLGTFPTQREATDAITSKTAP